MDKEKVKEEREGIELEKFKISIKFISPILGSAPPQETLSFYLAKQDEERKKQERRLKTEQEHQLSEATYTPEEKLPDDLPSEEKITRFRKDEHGVYLTNFQVKGFFKSAGEALTLQLKVKAIKSKIDRYVFIMPHKLYLHRDGKIIQTHDQLNLRPLTAMTMQGKRTSITVSEQIDSADIPELEVTMIKNSEITKDKLLSMLAYGTLSGISQWRNAGYGQFEYKLIGQRYSILP